MLINKDIILTEMQVGGIFCEQGKDNEIIYWNVIKHVIINDAEKYTEKCVHLDVELYRIFYGTTSTIQLISDRIDVDTYYISSANSWDCVYFDPDESKPIIEKLSKLHALYTIANEAINAFCSSASTPYISSLT